MGERQELTQEQRVALAGFLPFDKDATIEFTPDEYLQKREDGTFLIPDGYRPVFVVRAFTKEEKNKAMKMALDSKPNPTAQDITARGNGIRDMVRACIKGWRDLYDIGKNEYYEYRDTEECFESIPSQAIIITVYNFIWKISGLSKSDKLGLK